MAKKTMNNRNSKQLVAKQKVFGEVNIDNCLFFREDFAKLPKDIMICVKKGTFLLEKKQKKAKRKAKK